MLINYREHINACQRNCRNLGKYSAKIWGNIPDVTKDVQGHVDEEIDIKYKNKIQL